MRASFNRAGSAPRGHLTMPAGGGIHPISSHLPVLRDGETVGHAYEQTTYAEWAFSAYRTGKTVDGPLPLGTGDNSRTCQDCHMPKRTEGGALKVSKIASIQEFSNFPQAEYILPPKDIDLPARKGYASHILAGLNIFLIKMAQQFPDILGIRTRDPMLADKGLDPLLQTEAAINEQAASQTATISITKVVRKADVLEASVRVTNKAGHKFPSGVGFRRAFVEFNLLDEKGGVLWSSGRTNEAGVIVDRDGRPVDGEFWWNADCSARFPGLAHQPHREVISRQDQAQIYQELVTAPPREGPAICGPKAKPEGELTTSFLSVCARVKDNRILPHGFVADEDRLTIAKALGAGPTLAEESGANGVGVDPDYVSGGSDTTTYKVDLRPFEGRAKFVEANLHYQATPPFYLQDRFCTSRSADKDRLYFMAGRLNLKGSSAEGWKLQVAKSRRIPFGRSIGE